MVKAKSEGQRSRAKPSAKVAVTEKIPYADLLSKDMLDALSYGYLCGLRAGINLNSPSADSNATVLDGDATSNRMSFLGNINGVGPGQALEITLSRTFEFVFLKHGLNLSYEKNASTYFPGDAGPSGWSRLAKIIFDMMAGSYPVLLSKYQPSILLQLYHQKIQVYKDWLKKSIVGK